MQPEPLEQVVRNVDARLTRVEQILPTLATKEEMRAAIAEAIAPLATRAELREAIAPLATKAELREAIAPLATKAELREAIAPLATRAELREAIAPLATRADVAEEGARSRRYTNVLIEQVRSDIGLLAEHLSAVMVKLEGR
ncbi:MAG: hypothetical protein KGN76_14455 [Acidobacteriota bacterium]|nr:hypothetical protein [Acidobacteriota bacterium]